MHEYAQNKVDNDNNWIVNFFQFEEIINNIETNNNNNNNNNNNEQDQ